MAVKIHLGCYTICLVLFLCLTREALSQTRESSLVYTITEGLEEAVLIGNIAHDSHLAEYFEDTSNSTKVQLTIVPRDGNADAESMFHLDSTSGNLTSAKLIDREFICAYQASCDVNLDVQVQPSQYFEIIKVTIKILDLNDNAPKFEKGSITASISESASLGSTLAFRTADDPDSPKFGIQRYEQISDSLEFRLSYTTDPDAEDIYLILQNELDREVKDSLTLKIYVHDGGSPPKSSSVAITISVLDTNDNSPEFDKSSYEFSIQEDFPPFQTVGQVSAADPDLGDNGKVLYRFSSRTEDAVSHVFQINDTTGIITLLQHLDYEAKNAYTLNIVAENISPGSSSAQCVVAIQVKDVNDNNPEITINSEHTYIDNIPVVSVEESAGLGYFIAYLSVLDEDAGNNGLVSCELHDESHRFGLESLGATDFKVVTAQLLDRETTQKHILTVQCKDQGSPSRTSEQELNVRVLDVNDNRPVFDRPVYLSGLALNSTPGSWVATVHAIDLDEGENAELTYDIIKASSHKVTINPLNGTITLTEVPDVEVDQNWLNFTVVALDNGDPRLSGEAAVSVQVFDEKELAPHFTNKVYSFTIKENIPVGSYIGAVELINPVFPNFNPFRFEFTHDSKNIASFFVLDPRTGVINTRNMLDREAKDTYNLQVFATTVDTSLQVSSIATVTIQIADENDNLPFFVFPSSRNNTVYITHDHTPSEVIVKVKAKDLDSGSNAELKYSIFAGDPLEYFTINPVTGDLLLVADLRSVEPQKFSLTIKAEDSGLPKLSEEATLNIILRSGSAMNGKLPVYLGIAFGLGLMFFILVITVIIVLRKQKRTAKKCKKVEKMLDEKMKSLESLENHNNSQQILSGVGPGQSMLGDISHDSSEMESQRSPGIAFFDDNKRSSFCQNPNFGYLGDRDSDSGCSTDLSNTDSGKRSGTNGNGFLINYSADPNGFSYHGALASREPLWETHIPEDGPFQEKKHFSRDQPQRIQTRAMINRSLSASVAEDPQKGPAKAPPSHRLSCPISGNQMLSVPADLNMPRSGLYNGVNPGFVDDHGKSQKNENPNTSLDSSDSEPVVQRLPPPVFSRLAHMKVNNSKTFHNLADPSIYNNMVAMPHGLYGANPNYAMYPNQCGNRFSDDEIQRGMNYRQSDEESNGHRSDTAVMRSHLYGHPKRNHHLNKKRRPSRGYPKHGAIPNLNLPVTHITASIIANQPNPPPGTIIQPNGVQNPMEVMELKLHPKVRNLQHRHQSVGSSESDNPPSNSTDSSHAQNSVSPTDTDDEIHLDDLVATTEIQV